jgi:drug/metabolite transporter (DMT)-like permease
MDPVALAGALYTGPAIIAALALLLGLSKRGRYVRVTRRDVPRLAVTVLTGTIAAPVLLMYGIRMSSGFAASLMLNMEAVATALIALTFFGERVSPSIWLAVLCMTLTGILVTGTGGEGLAPVAGAMLILGSCAAWGIETNVVTTLSSRDPLLVTLIECLPAAVILTLVGAFRMGGLPPVRDLLLGVLLGSVSNGVGLLLYFVSLRTMGAARTAAFAGVGPLAGALLSLVLFRTPVTWVVVAALGLTAAAVLVVGRDDERRSLAWETVEG